MTSSVTPYYLEGKEINISFNGAEPLNAYLSLVKLITDKHEVECPRTQVNLKTYWSIFGYPNNAKCSLNLTVPWKNQIIARIYLSLETGVDNLFFFFDNQMRNSYGWHPSEYQNLVFQAQSDDYNNYVFWDFESDGSVQAMGFEAIFEEIGNLLKASDF